MTLDLPDAPNPAAIKTTDPNASCNLPPQPGDGTALEGGVTVGEVFGRPKPEAPDATPAVTQTESSEQPAEQPREASESTQATQGDQDATLPPELGLIEQLWTLYREQLAASLEQQATAIALEQAKNKHDEAREKNDAKRSAVQTFLSTFIEQLAAIRDPQAVAIAQSVADSIAEHEASQEPVEEPESDVGCTSMDWDEWRAIPTSEIVGKNKIAGLGPKKATALVDEFPTLGHLEDARTEAGKAHKHFCKNLVKGIGEQTADAILNAMQARLRIKGANKPEPVSELPAKETTALEVESADPPAEPSEPKQSPKKVPVAKVVDEVEPDSESEDDDSESEDSEPEQIGDSDQDADDDILYADVDDGADDEIDLGSGAESDPDDISWAEAYYRQILNDPAEVKAAWGENDKKHSAAWTTGNTSCEDWPVDSCPFDETKELEQAKDWVRGWTAASVLQMDL